MVQSTWAHVEINKDRLSRDACGYTLSRRLGRCDSRGKFEPDAESGGVRTAMVLVTSEDMAAEVKKEK